MSIMQWVKNLGKHNINLLRYEYHLPVNNPFLNLMATDVAEKRVIELINMQHI
jgi:hypothetical protein